MFGLGSQLAGVDTANFLGVSETSDVEHSDFNRLAAKLIQEAARIRAATEVKIRNMQTEIDRSWRIHDMKPESDSISPFDVAD